MPKIFPIMCLLLPLAAAAECGFVNGEQSMTIVVGAKGDRCFDSASFRDAFRDSLVASVRAMDGEDVPEQAGKKAFDSRNARGRKLWAIAERRHQSTLATASYYGQRR